MATASPSLAKTGKYGDLRRRLVFLLLALVVYRIGAHIPVPGINPEQLQALFQGQQGGILSLFNMFSGGALSRFTVFALGIMPYISASIIMQLMTYVVPTFEQLKKEGEAGRRKITQYTRYGTLALAIFQAMGIALALEGQAGLVIDPGMGLKSFLACVRHSRPRALVGIPLARVLSRVPRAVTRRQVPSSYVASTSSSPYRIRCRTPKSSATRLR